MQWTTRTPLLLLSALAQSLFSPASAAVIQERESSFNVTALEVSCLLAVRQTHIYPR